MTKQNHAPRYRFVFSGKCLEATENTTVREKLAQLLKSDSQTIDRIFSGTPIVIKSNLTFEAVKRYEAAFHQCGAIGEIKPEGMAQATETLNAYDAAPSPLQPRPIQDGNIDKPSVNECTPTPKPLKRATPNKKKYFILFSLAALFVLIGITFFGYKLISHHFFYIETKEPLAIDVIYNIQARIEDYVIKHQEYPAELSLVNQDLDPQAKLVRTIDEQGVITAVIAVAARNGASAPTEITLTYRPHYESGTLTWRCDPIDEAPSQVPVACQSLNSWQNNSIKVSTDDGLATLQLPQNWQKITNQDQMNLQYFEKNEDILLVSVSELKTQFELFTYGNYATVSLQLIIKNINGKYKIGIPRTRFINQRPSIDYRIQQLAKDSEFTYLITAIDGIDYYHRLVARVPTAKADYLAPKLEVITASFTEQYTPSTQPYQGRLIYPHGVYQGSVVHGTPSGEGVFTWSNGDKVSGTFDQNGPVGNITYIWQPDNSNDQTQFQGTVAAGSYTGNGEYIWPGGRFKGEIAYQRAHGDGVIEWKNGARYSGKFDSGLMHHSGQYVWPDGDSYTGEFSEGMFNGKGLCDFGGQQFDCLYQNGELVDEGALQ